MTGLRAPCPACWFALVVLLGFSGCNAPESKPGDASSQDSASQTTEQEPKQDAQAPDSAAKQVNLIDADQEKYQQVLAEHQGKYVLVDFWGTHCVPCIQKLPKMVKLQKQYQDELVVITFGMEYAPEQMREQCLEILQDKGTGNLINLYNTNEDWDSLYLPGAATLPYQRLYNPEGELITEFWNDPTEKYPSPDEVEAKLSELLGSEL